MRKDRDGENGKKLSEKNNDDKSCLVDRLTATDRNAAHLCQNFKLSDMKQFI